MRNAYIAWTALGSFNTICSVINLGNITGPLFFTLAVFAYAAGYYSAYKNHR